MKEADRLDLNRWIHIHVMHADELVGLMKRGYWYRPNAKGYTDRVYEAGRYTREEAKKHEYLRGDEPVTIHKFPAVDYCSNRSDAMMVLEKCAEKCGTVKIVRLGYWWVNDNQKSCEGKAESFSEAVCIFARELHSK